jgi:chemotaxis protein MotB
MARRQFEEEPDNHERWLISYADFITLLFAFFVVMYAISSVNEGKYQILSNALGSVFGAGFSAAAPTPKASSEPSPNQLSNQIATRKREQAIKRERANMTAMARDLQKSMAAMVAEGKVRVTQNSRGVSVEINASVLFAPGEAKLSPNSDAALKLVASILKDDKHAIQVEGHTDNAPINTALFASNWELSSARASSVVRLFAQQGVLDERLTAVGHAANKPVANNADIEGRARNRRVEITVLTAVPDPTVELPS